MAPHRFTIYSIVAASDLRPTWELPENVDALHSISLWGDPKSKGSRFLKRVRKTLGHIGDALVEDKEAPGLFAAQRRSASDTATPRRLSSSTKTRRDADAHDAFESFAWSIGDPDGGSDFLEGLHRLFDVSRGAPLIDSLRSAESLEVLLLVMRKMQLDDRSAASAATEVTVADACLALDLIERQLRPLFEPPPVVDLCQRDVERLSGTARTRRVLDLRHATHHQRARHLSSRALPLHQCVHVLTPRAKHLVEFLQAPHVGRLSSGEGDGARQ